MEKKYEIGKLACVEVLDYNKMNEERERRNEERAMQRTVIRHKTRGYDEPEL